jgi:hypothetical protein
MNTPACASSLQRSDSNNDVNLSAKMNGHSLSDKHQQALQTGTCWSRFKQYVEDLWT